MSLNEGHQKDIINTSSSGIDYNTVRLTFLEKDQSMNFLSQKSERLSLAVYLITDFLDYKESFRWEIRESSLSFMVAMNSISSFMSASDKERVILESLLLLNKIASLLKFGLSVRFVSQMNYSILKEEYSELYSLLQGQLSNQKPLDSIIFPQGFFTVNTADNKGHFNKGQKSIKDIKDINKRTDSATGEQKLSIIGNIDSHEPTGESNLNNSTNEGINKKSIRQDAIVRFLRTRESSNIKDISDAISDCGEKTIQRELMSLISRGVVKKTGERRWSKYSPV